MSHANSEQFGRWITYDCNERKFSATPFALELETIAEEHNPFAKPREVSQNSVGNDARET